MLEKDFTVRAIALLVLHVYKTARHWNLEGRMFCIPTLGLRRCLRVGIAVEIRRPRVVDVMGEVQ